MYIKSTKYNNQSRNHKLFLKYISYQVTKLTRLVQTFIYSLRLLIIRRAPKRAWNSRKGRRRNKPMAKRTIMESEKQLIYPVPNENSNRE